MWIVRWANILHLVDAATFVTPFKWPLAGHLLNNDQRLSPLEAGYANEWDVSDIPHTTVRGENQLGHLCSHIVILRRLI